MRATGPSDRVRHPGGRKAFADASAFEEGEELQVPAATRRRRGCRSTGRRLRRVVARPRPHSFLPFYRLDGSTSIETDIGSLLGAPSPMGEPSKADRNGSKPTSVGWIRLPAPSRPLPLFGSVTWPRVTSKSRKSKSGFGARSPSISGTTSSNPRFLTTTSVGRSALGSRPVATQGSLTVPHISCVHVLQ